MVQLHNWGWLLQTFSEVTRNTRKLLRCSTILGGQKSLGYCVKLFGEFLWHNSNFGCMYDDHILVSILEMKGANCLRPRFYRQFTDITGIPCSISPYTWHGLGYTWSGICGTSGTSIENMGPVENTCSENIWFVSYFWLKENNFAVQVYNTIVTIYVVLKGNVLEWNHIKHQILFCSCNMSISSWRGTLKQSRQSQFRWGLRSLKRDPLSLWS